MNFDFYTQFKEYSTVELLKIIQKAADYQSEAIKAAKTILAEREITQNELDQAQNIVKEEENRANALSNKISSYKEKTADFFQPILNPGTEVKPVKWLNILLLFIGVQYLWILYETIKGLLAFLACRYCSFDIFTFLMLINLLYIPLIFYLLYKKRRWGWILLFADNLVSLIMRLGESYTFFKYQEFHQGSTSTFLFFILVKLAFVFFLWRKPISNLFAVSDNTKKDTIMVAGTLGLAFVVLMYYLSA